MRNIEVSRGHPALASTYKWRHVTAPFVANFYCTTNVTIVLWVKVEPAAFTPVATTVMV